MLRYVLGSDPYTHAHSLSVKLATLPAEYGLYSSFVGVLIYCVSNSTLFTHSLSEVSLVLRHLQGRVHWTCRRHVPHGSERYQAC